MLKVVHGVGAASHAVLPDRSGRFQAMKIFAFDTMHVSVRLRWVMEHVPEVAKLISENDLLFGTVDTWLLWNLTGGKIHATDYSNASFTGLYDFYIMEWSDFVLKVLELPHSVLPEVRDTSGEFGETPAALFGSPIPIRAVVGDQQASLFGHCCFDPGDMKCSMGTGTFVCINTGKEIRTPSKYVMYPGVAWKIGHELTYMCETGSPGTGTALDWGTQFGLFPSVSKADEVARSVDSAGGAVFVNAFHGLGTPHHDGSAQASIMGLSSHTTPAHIAHALLQSLAFTFADLYEILARYFYSRRRTVRVDGGVSRSDFVLQTMATATNAKMQRSSHHELTSLGAAYLAGLGSGFWESKSELIKNVVFEREFEPKDKGSIRAALKLWRVAVQRTCKWPIFASESTLSDSAGGVETGNGRKETGAQGGRGEKDDVENREG